MGRDGNHDLLIFNGIPSGKLTELLKMAIYSGFSHEKWWFSIVMLIYQRVIWNIYQQNDHHNIDSSSSSSSSGWWCNNHLENYESQWEGWHPIYEMENNKCLKPPTSNEIIWNMFRDIMDLEPTWYGFLYLKRRYVPQVQIIYLKI